MDGEGLGTGVVVLFTCGLDNKRVLLLLLLFLYKKNIHANEQM